MACKTRRPSLRRAIQSVTDWCHRHRHLPVKAQHAAFDEAGDGNGVTVGSTRARTGKPGKQTRPRPHGPPRQLSTLPGEGSGWATASGYPIPVGFLSAPRAFATRRACHSLMGLAARLRLATRVRASDGSHDLSIDY
jgi:hypothetical protein